jgi:hypothetical protein
MGSGHRAAAYNHEIGSREPCEAKRCRGSVQENAYLSFLQTAPNRRQGVKTSVWQPLKLMILRAEAGFAAAGDENRDRGSTSPASPLAAVSS